eukprot:6385652-Amphidinium_carterae.1
MSEQPIQSVEDQDITIHWHQLCISSEVPIVELHQHPLEAGPHRIEQQDPPTKQLSEKEKPTTNTIQNERKPISSKSFDTHTPTHIQLPPGPANNRTTSQKQVTVHPCVQQDAAALTNVDKGQR